MSEIPLTALTGWEVGSDKAQDAIILRLHCPLPQPYVALSATQCVQLAHDLLGALRTMQTREETTEKPPDRRLQGSTPRR